MTASPVWCRSRLIKGRCRCAARSRVQWRCLTPSPRSTSWLWSRSASWIDGWMAACPLSHSGPMTFCRYLQVRRCFLRCDAVFCGVYRYLKVLVITCVISLAVLFSVVCTCVIACNILSLPTRSLSVPLLCWCFLLPCRWHCLSNISKNTLYFWTFCL